MKRPMYKKLFVFLLMVPWFFCAASQEAEAWWNNDYSYRQQITVTNNDSIQLGANTLVAFTENTGQLITAGKLRSDGNDWRIVYDDGLNEQEIAQHVESGWNGSVTETWFRLQAAIDAGASTDKYYVYYGYSGESSSPSTFTTSEQELESYTTKDSQGNEAFDYNSTEWGGAQGVQFDDGTSRYWKITRFSFYKNQGNGSSSQVAGFVFAATGSLEGDEISNGKSNAVAANTFSIGFNDLTWGSAKPKVEADTQYYIAILPTSPAGRNSTGGWYRWDFDKYDSTYRSASSGCKAYGVKQNGEWGFFWVPDGADRAFRVYGREAANDDLSASTGGEQGTGSVSITITSPTSGPSYSTDTGVIMLGGSASSSQGIVEVTWSNSAGGSDSCSGKESWNTGSIALASGNNVITVTARDSANNTASDVLTVSYIPDPDPDPGGGGDVDVLTGEGPPPNVLIILDHSGSMLDEDPEHAYDGSKTYTPWAGMPDKGSNYENWRWYHKTRWQIAKHVVTHLINDTPGVRFGLMRMDGNLGDAFDGAGTYGGGQDNWGIPNPAHVPYEYAYDPKAMRKGPPPDQIFPFPFGVTRHGGKLLKPCGTDKQALIDYINGMEIYKTIPHSYTNVAETLFTAGQYFSDGHGPITMGQYKDSADTNWAYGSYWANNTDDYGNVIDTSSPIQYWCQHNYVILITDGEANCDSDWQTMIDAVGDHDGDNDFRESNPLDIPPSSGWCDPLSEYNIDPVAPCDPSVPFVEPSGEFRDKYPDGLTNPFPFSIHTFVDDVAQFLYDTDLRSDMDGEQNIITYTVGFSLLGEEYDSVKGLLNKAGTQAGGAYYTADDFEQLHDALQEIVDNIMISQTTAVGGPVVPLQHENRLQTGDSIYMAMFKSEDNSHMGIWPGNLKKFRLATEDNPSKGVVTGDIIDAGGNKATNAAGTILDSARSYWLSAESGLDGGRVLQGGVGGVLLDRNTQRNIYTYLGSSVNLTDGTNRLSTSNSEITRVLLNVESDAEKENVINYVHGLDVDDEDEDGDHGEKRSWILGDIIHSSPAVCSYTGDRTVIFVGSNDGMLHAFDDSDGRELWAFVPPIFLKTIRHVRAATHRYFVDGSPVIWSRENPSDGDVNIDPTDPEDQVLLICGLRRGGEGYFALDVTDPDEPKIPAGWAAWGIWESGAWRSTGMIGPDMTTESVDEMTATYPYSEMGQTWSKPRIGMVDVGGVKKWVAFVGGGYDATNEDPIPPLADEKGRAVYCFDIQNGSRTWGYTHANDATMAHAIPSDVALLDANGDNTVDRIYVGDLGGRIWRFDWGASAKLVFESGGDRKIFYPPDVVEEDAYPMLFFGSGDRAHPNAKTVIDRIYAVKDRRETILDESDLADVTLDKLQDEDFADEHEAIRVNLALEDGWYIRLVNEETDAAEGEKSLSRAIVFGGVAFMTTFTPPDEVLEGEDPCAVGQGTAKVYALDYKTGEAALNLELGNDTASGVVLNRSDRTLSVGSYIPSAVMLIVQGGNVRYYVSVGTAGGPGVFGGDVGSVAPVYPIYWRELR